MNNEKFLQQKIGALLLPKAQKQKRKINYEIAYMLDKLSDMSYCYADSKARAIKIAQRMKQGNYYFVEIAKQVNGDFDSVILF